MKINEIIESGLLELYVIGDLSEEQMLLVESHIEKFPQLKENILEIEKALYLFSQANAINPKPQVKKSLLQKINPGIKNSNNQGGTPSKDGNGSGLWKFLVALLALATAAAFYWANSNANKLRLAENEKIQIQEDCDSAQVQSNELLDMYQKLLDPDASVISITPTEKYPQTQINLYANNANRENYLKLNNLPPINQNQSYQLWSLKGTDAPIPLDVFQGDSLVLPIRFEEGTNLYAITIEPLGGQNSPTLENLIGTFQM